MKLNTRALGFACGVIWGLVILLTSLISLWSAGYYGKEFLQMLVSIYPGYGVSSVGAILGLCYGFVDGFIGGWLVAKLYNYFAK